MFLTTPRITGLLFNCAMNCALPRLLENIHALAKLEQEGNLPSSSDAVYANHERLKTVFMTYYGIQHDASFSWEMFSNFLDTHSFYAQEIMFAPVFRIFIADIAQRSGHYATTDLERIRDLQSPNAEADEIYAAIGEVNPAIGRYNNIEISTVSELFYASLAIGNVKLCEHEASTDTYVERVTGAPSNSIIPSWIQRSSHDFSMYLRDAHYELLPHHELAEQTACFHEEINTLPPSLAEVHDILSASDSAEQSSQGLGRLVTYVHDALGTWMNDAARLDKKPTALLGEINYDTYKGLNADYHSNTDVGRATFAAILLAIAARTPELKEQAEALLKQDKLSREQLQVILNPDCDLATTFELIQQHQPEPEHSERGRVIQPSARVEEVPTPSETARPAAGLTVHGVFNDKHNSTSNVPYRTEFKAACTQMMTVLGELKHADKITQAELDALRREIKYLYRNPESHKQFLQTMQQCEALVGGKFMAYCMLAVGYAAKICSLGYRGDTWIEQANQKLEHIKALENFASEAEVFYNSPR